ncbi:MAG: lipopolysaccharide assembly protein LapB [Caldimonas sp.]
MDFEHLQWLLWGLPLAFAFGWLASRVDMRQWKREQKDSPKVYYKGLNLLLNEQQDKAIDAFIEAVQQDPDTSDLHFALGNLFRRRGEYERAVRVHEHLLHRADLPKGERDRAQYALAQDFMKAGLLDRAEAAYRALDGTAFATEARLALLSLLERSRDWRAAIEVAQQLEQTGTASFATRISHYWCEVALEADTARDVTAADEALQHARDSAPQAARPRILTGQRAAQRGALGDALRTWSALTTLQPTAFNLIAREYAAAALASGERTSALDDLEAIYRRTPTLDVLDAIGLLEPDAPARYARLLEHLRAHPTLAAARAVLEEGLSKAVDAPEAAAVRNAVERAARPLHRYRCAACGFEAEHYFWQCPGCLGWDTYPPQRLEDL